jgi:DNA polymerase-3 subunit delta'
MAFENIQWQKRAVAMLRAALRTGLIPHAYLLVGPGGVGGLSLARELAGVLLCGKGGEDRCGKCRNCLLLEAGSHPDYHEVGVPEGKQEVPIDAVRTMQRQASVKPLQADRRVFVVRDVDRMNIAAANCFLKTLEEPPGSCCFILIAASLWDIPPTVVSRCRVVKLAGLPPAQVEEALRADGVSAEDAWWLARRSWGSPGMARAFKEMGLPEFNRQLAKALCELSAEDNFRFTEMLLEAMPEGSSRAEARIVLQDLLECLVVLYRDMAALAVAGDKAELFNRDLPEPLRKVAASCSVDEMVEWADRTLDAIERVGANANERVTLDDLFSHVAGAASAGRGSRGGR